MYIAIYSYKINYSNVSYYIDGFSNYCPGVKNYEFAWISIDSLYLYIYIIFDQLIVNYVCVCVIISDRTTIFNSRKKQLRKSSI